MDRVLKRQESSLAPWARPATGPGRLTLAPGPSPGPVQTLAHPRWVATSSHNIDSWAKVNRSSPLGKVRNVLLVVLKGLYCEDRWRWSRQPAL
jgi:hypothetical protein